MPLPPPEVVSTAVALLVESAVACGALEVEALAVCMEHAAQVCVRVDMDVCACVCVCAARYVVCESAVACGALEVEALAVCVWSMLHRCVCVLI